MKTALLETINQTCEANIGYGTAPQEIISTGIPQLDAVTGGGIPRGRIVEIHGNDGSGKTALALHLAQRTGGAVLYADADHGLSPYILRGRELYLLNVDTLEDALSACQTAALGGFSAVVIDTVTAFPTGEDMQVGINDKYGMKNSKPMKLQNWQEMYIAQSRCLSGEIPIFLHIKKCLIISKVKRKDGKQV